MLRSLSRAVLAPACRPAFSALCISTRTFREGVARSPFLLCAGEVDSIEDWDVQQLRAFLRFNPDEARALWGPAAMPELSDSLEEPRTLANERFAVIEDKIQSAASLLLDVSQEALQLDDDGLVGATARALHGLEVLQTRVDIVKAKIQKEQKGAPIVPTPPKPSQVDVTRVPILGEKVPSSQTTQRDTSKAEPSETSAKAAVDRTTNPKSKATPVVKNVKTRPVKKVAKKLTKKVAKKPTMKTKSRAHKKATKRNKKPSW